MTEDKHHLHDDTLESAVENFSHLKISQRKGNLDKTRESEKISYCEITTFRNNEDKAGDCIERILLRLRTSGYRKESS